MSSRAKRRRGLGKRVEPTIDADELKTPDVAAVTRSMNNELSKNGLEKAHTVSNPT